MSMISVITIAVKDSTQLGQVLGPLSLDYFGAALDGERIWLSTSIKVFGMSIIHHVNRPNQLAHPLYSGCGFGVVWNSGNCC